MDEIPNNPPEILFHKGSPNSLESLLNINVAWLTFDLRMFALLFPRLKQGILCDVFIQKAVVAWKSAPGNRILVSLLLPDPMGMDQWLKEVRACINMWPHT